MRAVFRAPVARSRIYITVPVYADEDEASGVEGVRNRKGRHIVGTRMLDCYFCEGKDNNEYSMDTDDDPEKLYRLREYIASNPEYVEVPCDSEPLVEPPKPKKPDTSDWDSKYTRMLIDR